MQFQADDEDGDFLVSGGSSRSRLSSLFQSENSSGDINQALTFTAPKQPKKNDTAQGAPGGAMTLLHAAVVHAYKLNDGTYSNQGKLGCAILGHHETCIYKVLLYKGKQIQVTCATITPSFIFHVQPNNYANFYDEKKENWSVNFDSEAALLEFTKQVALAKANSQGKSLTALITQDLVTGEGQTLDTGDAIEVKYTGWLLSNFTFGQVFDSNMNSDSLYRLRLGKSKVIKGWSEGLVGIQKGGKRLLIIPPDLAYGAEGMSSAVPPNSTLIFEIHAIKIKAVREASHSPSPIKVPDSTAEKKPDVTPRQSFSQEDNIRMRGASISEQLSQSPKKDKAQLISRMAKMGTATLPFQGAIPAQVNSDSESEVEIPQSSSPAPQNVSRTSSPKPTAKPRSRTSSGHVASNRSTPPQSVQAAVPFNPPSQMSLYDPSAMPTQSPIVCGATPFPGYSPQLPAHYSMLQSSFAMQNVPQMVPSVPTSMVDSHLPMLMTETRNQNTEIRISLSKVADKVDTILNKVEDIRLQGRAASTNMPFMEGTVLLQNIERIVQENIQLKGDVESKNSKIQLLNEKICDLFQRNQRFFEESSSMLEQRSDTLQATSAQSQEKILSLEQEKARLQLELSTNTIKMNTFEAEFTKYQALESELRQKLLEAEKEAKKQENLLNDTKEQVSDLQTQLRKATENLKAFEQENILLTSKIESMKQEPGSSLECTELVEIYKKEIQQYKEKIEEMKSAINQDSSVAKLEEERDGLKLELEKSTKLQSSMKTEVEMLQKQLISNKELQSSYMGKLTEMKDEVDKYYVLKKKHEVFQEKTRAMKERFESQILELMNEIRHLQTIKTGGSSPDFSSEIKKVMNALYKLLQGKFDPSSTYTGSNILETVLLTIRGLTLQILQRKNQSSGDHLALESSEKENPSMHKESHYEKTPKTEFNQQNGTKVEEAADSKETFSNPVPLNETQTEETSKVVKENIPVSPETNDSTANIPGPTVNHIIDDVEAESANTTTDMKSESANTTTDMKSESAITTTDMKSESANTTTDMKSESANTTTDMKSESADAAKDVKSENVDTTADVKSESVNAIEDAKSGSTAEVQSKESNKPESPESNMHQPSSSLFSEPLSGTDGTKMWRPQPPPLFDDDDEEDDDDDDWLK